MSPSRVRWCSTVSRGCCDGRKAVAASKIVGHDVRVSTTAAAQFIASLDPLAYPDRMRLVAGETRRLADSNGLDTVLDELAGGGDHERTLALTMARIAGRTGRMIAALDDPDHRIRAQALVACIRTPQADDAVIATLPDSPIAWRESVVRAVRAARRPQLADRLMDAYRDQLPDPIAARLLPGCSAETVARLLPDLAHAGVPWGALGAHHAEIVLDFAEGELAGLPDLLRDAWWARCGDGVATASGSSPLRVLDLLERFPATHGLPFSVTMHMSTLARADQTRVLRLLVQPTGDVAARLRVLSRGLRKKLAATGLPEVEVWGRAVRETPAAFAELLRALPPGRRPALYDAATVGKDPARMVISLPVLDALPRERRYAEARRMLTLPSVDADPDQRLRIAARLPWTEARTDLVAATRVADPLERARAYPLLIGAAAASGDPAAVTTLLSEDLGRLRNEQDPVRRAALSALAAVPPKLFEESATVVDALTRLVTDALEARDTSWPSRESLRVLACAVLAHQAVGNASEDSDLLIWALIVFDQLAGTTGGMSLGRLNRTLRRGQEHEVYQALAPWIRRAAEHGDHQLALSLADALGKRAWALADLQETLADAVQRGTNATASRAITLWLADYAHRDTRVAQVLAWDPSAAVLWPVSRVLSRRRTDLLDTFLTGEAHEGRFVTKGTRWFPQWEPSGRWLPRQIEAHARLLTKVADDKDANSHARVQAIRTLGHLPGGPGRQTILRYVESADVPLAEAALASLAWSQDPASALPLLLEYADGDRARVAVYAANRAARHAPPAAAMAALRAVALSPTAKVTSRKEVLRIAADLTLPGATDLLITVWQAENQHRHVKAAAVLRLAYRLDDERALPLLQQATTGDSEIAAQVLRVHPLELPARHRAEYAELIFAACRVEDQKIRNAAFGAVPNWYTAAPSAADVVCDAITDPGRDNAGAMLPAALHHLLFMGMPADRYLGVLTTLLEADAADLPLDARANQDRAARRRLGSVVNYTLMLPPALTAHRRPLLRAASDMLRPRVGFRTLAAELAAAAVDFQAPAEVVVRDVLALAALVDGRPQPVDRAAARLSQQISARTPWDAACVLAAAQALSAASVPGAGRIAVRLLAVAGPALAWPEPYRLAASALRQHGDPDTVEAALELDTSEARS